jgi:PIN domain nuclease of toxin-antitoxin system
VRLLLDTHVLLWAAGTPEKLSPAVRALLASGEQRLMFSAASLWEIAIKRGLGRVDFRVDPHVLRRGLDEHGYEELPVTSRHALVVDRLPPIHRDPFDRMLIAQATAEGVTLLTADAVVASYPGPIRRA